MLMSHKRNKFLKGRIGRSRERKTRKMAHHTLTSFCFSFCFLAWRPPSFLTLRPMYAYIDMYPTSHSRNSKSTMQWTLAHANYVSCPIFLPNSWSQIGNAYLWDKEMPTLKLTKFHGYDFKKKVMVPLITLKIRTLSNLLTQKAFRYFGP